MNSKPYVFISYAHYNSDIVLPCVRAMQSAGINLWYDEGIEAGSEWPEFIAQKVVSCTKFVLFVSEAYLNSQNCKREFNFAISRKKEILTIYIEDVNLSPGMEMQLGTYQAIYKKRFESEAKFHKSLCGERFFDICRVNRDGLCTVADSEESKQGEQSTTDIGKKESNKSFSESFSDLFSRATGKDADKNSGGGAPILKNRYVAALLALFFGIFGVHKFYLKQNLQGVLYLLFCWTYIPIYLGFAEFFILLFCSKAKLEKFYECKFK